MATIEAEIKKIEPELNAKVEAKMKERYPRYPDKITPNDRWVFSAKENFKKEILKTDYGIDWRTENELYPWRQY